jgi:hypothetical protein
VPLQKGHSRRMGRERRFKGAVELENQCAFVDTPKPNAKQHYHWCSVFDGRECIGHIVGRGKLGVEAFDAHDRSIGIFATVPLAANALSNGGAL